MITRGLSCDRFGFGYFLGGQMGYGPVFYYVAKRGNVMISLYMNLKFVSFSIKFVTFLRKKYKVCACFYSYVPSLTRDLTLDLLCLQWQDL